jgi:hypothetical protein
MKNLNKYIKQIEDLMSYASVLSSTDKQNRISRILSDVYDLGHCDGYGERFIEELKNETINKR